jgi:hypothetical protein
MAGWLCAKRGWRACVSAMGSLAMTKSARAAGEWPVAVQSDRRRRVRARAAWPAQARRGDRGGQIRRNKNKGWRRKTTWPSSRNRQLLRPRRLAMRARSTISRMRSQPSELARHGILVVAVPCPPIFEDCSADGLDHLRNALFAQVRAAVDASAVCYGDYAAAGPDDEAADSQDGIHQRLDMGPYFFGLLASARPLSTAPRTSRTGGARTAARRVLEQVRVHLVRGERDVADDGAADEAVLDREHVRVPRGVRDGDAVEPDVQEPAGAQSDVEDENRRDGRRTGRRT